MTDPADVLSISVSNLKTKPYFRLFSNGDLFGPVGSAAALDPYSRAKVLAEGIPAISRSAGRNAVNSLGGRNRDLVEFQNSWPSSRNGRWLHSDAKDVAYTYNFPLFENWVTLGALKNE